MFFSCVTGLERGHMDGVLAELDLGPIDKVDVRNEIGRFSMVWGSEVHFPNLAFC